MVVACQKAAGWLFVWESHQGAKGAHGAGGGGVGADEVHRRLVHMRHHEGGGVAHKVCMGLASMDG